MKEHTTTTKNNNYGIKNKINSCPFKRKEEDEMR